MNNTNLTRLKREYELMKKKPNENFNAYPIQDDLFTWHFTIRGMEDTEFEGGFYHGIIKLPNSYPLKPPNIMFLNPNGRFDVNMDVCLSVTKFHRDEWQASWTIATILEALIAFFPIKENHDAIGAIDYPLEVRKKYAQNSKKWKCEICGLICNTLPEKISLTKHNQADQVNPELRKNSQLSASDQNANDNENHALIDNPKKKTIIPNEQKVEKKASFNNNENIGQSSSSNNLNKEEEEISNIAINNESQNNKSEKEDNNSDMSSLVNQKIDNQEIKIVKKSKIKKADFDRKSHLSHNIEGVIFEDINEDDEWEEKEKLHSTENVLFSGHKKSFEEIYDKDSMNIKNEILKKINSNNNNSIENHFSKNSNFGNNEENYFEKVNFNDINNIIKRNNSFDNSIKEKEKIETAKSNIMQELLKHRNLGNIKENENNNQKLNNLNSNLNPNAVKNFINDNELKEKFISFENENIGSKNSLLQNNNNTSSSKNNLNYENFNSKNKKNYIMTEEEEREIINDIKIENINASDKPTSNIGYILDKIKKEKQKEILIKEIKEKIAKQSNDESEFYEVARSIKIHKTTDKEEILEDIIQGNLKNFIQKGEILESLLSLGGIKKKENKESEELQYGKKRKNLSINSNKLNDKKGDDHSLNTLKKFDNELTGVVELMQNLNQNTKSEKLKNFVNCKNNALNLLTKTRYSENKVFRLRIVNGIAFIFIVLVFLLYHYYLRYI